MRAQLAIAAMADTPLIPDWEHIYSQSRPSALILRFPKTIWNAHHSDSPTKSRTVAKDIQARKKTTAPRNLQSSPRRKPKCKSKLCRFQYGGPQRRVAGKQKNEIHYEQPCLSQTCPNCQYWHPNWFKMENSLGAQPSRPGAEPPTPPASPEPENMLWDVPLDCIDPRLLPPQCGVFLPTRPVDHVIQPLIPAETQWWPPLGNRPAKLESKLLDNITTTAKSDILVQPKSILKSPLKIRVGKDDGARRKKVRFRHRVLCVFQSEQGKDKFRRVVECL